MLLYFCEAIHVGPPRRRHWTIRDLEHKNTDILKKLRLVEYRIWMYYFSEPSKGYIYIIYLRYSKKNFFVPTYCTCNLLKGLWKDTLILCTLFRQQDFVLKTSELWFFERERNKLDNLYINPQWLSISSKADILVQNYSSRNLMAKNFTSQCECYTSSTLSSTLRKKMTG